MNRNDTCYQNYVKILKEELRPAMGSRNPSQSPMPQLKPGLSLVRFPNVC